MCLIVCKWKANNEGPAHFSIYQLLKCRQHVNIGHKMLCQLPKLSLVLSFDIPAFDVSNYSFQRIYYLPTFDICD